MKKVIAYGTFDVFHVGHLNFLQKAKSLGDYLIVGVTSDEFNKEKGKVTLFSYKERVKVVENIRCVDEVFKANGWDEKIEDVERHRADLVVAGEEWRERYEPLKKYCEVVFLPRYEGVSSTMARFFLEKIDELMHLLSGIHISKRKELVNLIEREIKRLMGK